MRQFRFLYPSGPFGCHGVFIQPAELPVPFVSVAHIVLWIAAHTVILFLCNLPDTYIVGGPIREIDGNSGRYINIFLDLSFRSRGYVRQWHYFAQRAGGFVASVWRPLGNDSYQLVSRDYIEAIGTGVAVSIPNT